MKIKIDGLRRMYKYQNWRRYIKRRDNYACQECGCKKNLCVHHITPLAVLVKGVEVDTIEEIKEQEEIWDIDNAITLCKDCHKRVHNKE